MLRLKDSHGVIQERGRGPVNEFGQDSEKRFIYCLNRRKKKKKGRKNLSATERGPEPGLSNRADPVLEEWDEKGIFMPKNVWMARAGFRACGRKDGPTLALATGPGSCFQSETVQRSRVRLPGGVVTSLCPHVHTEANPAVYLPYLLHMAGTETTNTKELLQ